MAPTKLHITPFINAGDLTPLTLGNVFCKYADDTYLVIPALTLELVK